MSGPNWVDVTVTAQVHDIYDVADLIRRYPRKYAAVAAFAEAQARAGAS